MKKHKDFIQLLKNHLIYRTKSKFRWRAIWPSFFFYWQIVKIISWRAIWARLGKFNNNDWTISSYQIIKAAENCGGRLTIEGLENLTNLKTPAVFMANHMSTLENFILPIILLSFTDNLCFVIKKELLKFPIFKHIMKATKPIPIGRNNPREDWQFIMEEGKKRLERGYSVVIFPQSTRYPEVKPADFNSSALKLAIAAGAPLVPIALKTDFWGNRWNSKKLKNFGRIEPKKSIHFLFGQPVWAGKKQEKEILKQAVGFIADNFAAW